jgi:hypothetical protein
MQLLSSYGMLPGRLGKGSLGMLLFRLRRQGARSGQAATAKVALRAALVAILSAAPAGAADAPSSVAAPPTGTAVKPGGQDLPAAARAFTAAQQAEVAREWSRAAELYELADRIAASPEALRSAARSRLAAGDAVTAATHADELLKRYPDESVSTTLAASILRQAEPKVAQWIIHCNPGCTIAVDSGAVSTDPRAEQVVYVEPGEHRLQAFFSGSRNLARTLMGEEGSRKHVFLEPASEGTELETAGPAAPERPKARKKAGLPAGVAWSGLALTAVWGGLALWSGLDTLHAHDEFKRNPTPEGYKDGLSREHRTNALIGATAVTGAATLVIALFATRWSSDPEVSSAPHVTATAGPHQAEVVFEGSF